MAKSMSVRMVGSKSGMSGSMGRTGEGGGGRPWVAGGSGRPRAEEVVGATMDSRGKIRAPARSRAVVQAHGSQRAAG